MHSIFIKKADVRIWRAKLSTPFRTAKGQHDFLANVLFRVELTNGTQGFGEAAVATHITGETIEVTLKHLKEAAWEVQDHSIAAFPSLTEKFKERFAGNKCALAALEMALLDAMTRVKKMPLWRAFGNRVRKIRTDMTVILGDVNDAENAAREILKRGICSLKVKVGGNFDMDLRRVAAVSKLAKRCPIYLDANQGFTAVQTLKFLKELDKLKITPALIEQPVPKEDWEGLKNVTRNTKILVCADESVSSFEEAKRLIKEKAAGAINIKYMKTGILEAYEIARMAQQHHIQLMIGGMMETPLATTASAHLAAGLGGFDFIDLDAPFFMAQTITRGSYVNKAGVYDLCGVKAGIGVTPQNPVNLRG